VSGPRSSILHRASLALSIPQKEPRIFFYAQVDAV
jgi:hypothetical protein